MGGNAREYEARAPHPGPMTRSLPLARPSAGLRFRRIPFVASQATQVPVWAGRGRKNSSDRVLAAALNHTAEQYSAFICAIESLNSFDKTGVCDNYTSVYWKKLLNIVRVQNFMQVVLSALFST